MALLLYPISLSPSPSVCPLTLHPFLVPVKVLLLLLLPRSPPFFFSRVFLLSSITDFYPGFLTPFFPVSCHVTAVYESVGQTRGERSLATALCKSRVCVNSSCSSPEFRYYPRAGPYLDRPDFHQSLRKPLLLPRFMGFSSLFLERRGRGGFFRAHCARSNTTRERERDG